MPMARLAAVTKVSAHTIRPLSKIEAWHKPLPGGLRMIHVCGLGKGLCHGFSRGYIRHPKSINLPLFLGLFMPYAFPGEGTRRRWLALMRLAGRLSASTTTNLSESHKQSVRQCLKSQVTSTSNPSETIVAQPICRCLWFKGLF